MPYGFAQNRLKKGIKPSTVKFQVIVVEQLFSFLRGKHKRDIAPNEIVAKDIRDYLDYQKNVEKYKDATIYRKQSNLKVFFNYLWEQRYISHDIMEKFEYFQEPIHEIRETRSLNYDYEFLLEQQKRVLNSKLTDTCKFLMLLYIKGIEVSDMYDLQVDHVSIKDNVAEIKYVSRNQEVVKVEYTDEQEIAVIESIVHRATIVRDTPYLISVKPKNQATYGQSKPLLTRFYISEINKFIGINLRSDDVRLTYVYYLYQKQKKTIDEIAEILGRKRKSISTLVETAIERMNHKKYNNDIVHNQNTNDVDTSIAL
ncbi:site-specific integrase (plasmid) [Ureibacillus chungkukjangi]|uniref:phage integrase N-terminal SAM-like domain-containing protein n=1 Tax=Ureibacillus chungkukjangi TaxID=1202712 RepID=UPI000D3C7929|nr:phage integrase N-terminal SAM-like domain-containing protein [Ureibacillus chungkukjangi]MCM3390573.1 site-specific integrase [Ureibacillus chungkukjangi]